MFVLELLKTHFGFDAYRPLQKDIIDTVVSGKDTLVLMPTGGGKSLCYQLPALALPGMTLVVSPLIALMKDQVDALCANGISAAFINSSLTTKEQEAVTSRVRSGDLKILYIAPERVDSYGFSDLLDSVEISLLAIDEAHCISQWGHDFRPDYRNLGMLRRKLAGTPVVALTATATPRVRQDILQQLMMPKAEVFISSFNRENLHYSVRPKFNAVSQLVELLESQKGESTIVYCFSRKNTEEIAQALVRAGFKAAAYHAGLPKQQRMQVQDQFARDEIPVIVATIAFGMGIDKPDVRLVVHMDLPKTIEGYYQETGRAGRDGLPSECVLFYTYADKRKQEFFINQLSDPQEHALATRKLEDVIMYCQSDVCRRFILLAYFGELDADTSCEACDNCTEPSAVPIEATEISQKILSAVLRTGERFGAAHVCDVLRGSKKKRILELGHDGLSVHGIAKNVSAGLLREYTQALKKCGYLNQSEGEYPVLEVSPKGRLVLMSKEEILLPVRQVEKSRSSSVSKSKTKSNLDYDQVLFEKLRALRKEIADQQNVPPFVIFGDKTLHEMAYYLPSGPEAFSNLFGVGRKKLEAFGEEFLACVSAEVLERGLEEKPVTGKVPQHQSGEAGKLSSTLEQTKVHVSEKMSIDKIAELRGLSVGTIMQHIEKLVHEDEALDIEHLRPGKDSFDEMEEAFRSVKGSSLTAVFRRLGEKYSYDDLRLVRMFLVD